MYVREIDRVVGPFLSAMRMQNRELGYDPRPDAVTATRARQCAADSSPALRLARKASAGVYRVVAYDSLMAIESLCS